MDNKSKVEVAKMRSLMERMEKPQSYYSAMLNEEKLVSEAISKNRQQVTRDQIIDLLNKADNNPKNNGLFASVTYVNYKEPYKTKRSWRTDDVTNALNASADRGEEDWHKQLTAFNQPNAKGKNPISTVVVTQRYTLHWTSQENYKKKYGEYANALHDLRMKNGVGINSDGMLGNNNNQRQMSDTGVQFNQTGNLSRDFNMAGSKCKTTVYLVNDTGNIVTELPGDVLKSMTALPSAPKPEKDVAAALSGPVLDAYMQAKAELDKSFRPQNLLFDKILCIAANVDGISYYYINDMLKTPIGKGSDVNVNPQEMLEIAKEQLGESFDAIQGFAN